MSVISPFVTTFKVLDSPALSDSLQNPESNTMGSCALICSREQECVKHKCTIQNTQRVSISIQAIIYRHTYVTAESHVLPGNMIPAILASGETLAVQLPSLPRRKMNESRGLGYLVVCWSTVNKNFINDQIVETYIYSFNQ